MIKRMLLAAGMIGLSLSQTWPAEQNVRLEKLATAIEQSFDQRKETKPDKQGITLDAGRILLAQLRSATALNNTVQLESALIGLSGTIDSAPLRKKCIDLAAQLSLERQANEKKTLTAIEAAMEHAKQTVRAATKAADLDGVLHELARLTDHQNEQTPTISSAMNQVEAALQFVTHWQDYLAFTSAGNALAARDALQILSNGRNSKQPDWISRSEILARIQFIIKPPERPRADILSERPNNESPPASEPPTVKEPLRNDRSTGAIGFTINKLDDPLPQGVHPGMTPALSVPAATAPPIPK